MQGTSPVIKAVAVWLLALMLTIAAAVVVTYFVNAKVYGPQKHVESYLQKLADGEGEEALGLLNAKVPEANAALLDDDALRASVQGLEVLEVGDAEDIGGDRVEVPLKYAYGSAEGTTSFVLENTGKRWLFFDTWDFEPAALPTVQVTAPSLREATLNGVRVTLPEGANTFAAFPLSRVAASYESQYLAAPEQETLVTADGDPQLTLVPEATKELVTKIDAGIREFLDGCTAADRLAPPGCPFFHETNNRVEQPIRWSIQDYPDVELTQVEGRWVLSPLTGTAQVTATQVDLFTGGKSPLVAEEAFTFTASLRVDGENVTLSPQVQ
ncbi:MULTISPECIES: hypothetical protein [unclassified Arthrobacter]|uniref:hypothetical protein n=1 Tax=unclassified Arthrobacter TaxID=235627 RepID=UPI001E396405|nr:MULTISPECIES: hypothetical protein [unclassified Arthrobacter]MCC9144647.1 hypothetical protein [Arthrobacter sp. zg-Y919]MDK1275873.1 hypothetical protein [Arthrobacter sp. zg.Y919]MDM7990268.1 hypothetical protein [Arthrobacter sp. zg-Y877]WIB02768.1 hypothetical protein QNO10_12605 [Arthrobacter sp. zg-Y919]